MSDDFSINVKHPEDEMFCIPGANERLDEIWEISKRIHESRCVSFDSREHLRIEGAKWERKQYHGKSLFLPNRLALLEMCRITEEDLGVIPSQLAKEFEAAISEFIELMDSAKTSDRKLISFNVIEKAFIKYAADLEGKNFSQYVSEAAFMVAVLNAYPPDGINSGSFGLEQANRCAVLGAKLHDAFKPEEVKQAMDVVGISASQAVNLMAELERLRDARMNPNLMAGGSQQAHP